MPNSKVGPQCKLFSGHFKGNQTMLARLQITRLKEHLQIFILHFYYSGPRTFAYTLSPQSPFFSSFHRSSFLSIETRASFISPENSSLTCQPKLTFHHPFLLGPLTCFLHKFYNYFMFMGSRVLTT